MGLEIVPTAAGTALAGAVASELGTGPATGTVERFPDGEVRPAVGEMRGEDVYVVGSTGPPVNDHLVELLLWLDACRRAGADRVTAVVPYFGYCRQDRRSRAGQAIATRVVADAIAAAGADRVVVVDPHSPAIEATFTIPVDTVSAVPALAAALRRTAAPGAVVVAPDLGAVKLAERYAAMLGRPLAIVRKTRLSGADVRADQLIGTFDGRPAIVVDDMISTGGTIEAATRLALDHGAAAGTTVVATHGLFVGAAAERLTTLPLERLLVTDSVDRTDAAPPSCEVLSIGPLLADTISRLHRGDPLDGLLLGA